MRRYVHPRRFVVGLGKGRGSGEGVWGRRHADRTVCTHCGPPGQGLTAGQEQRPGAMTNTDWWARVVQARTAHHDLLPQRVWTLHKGEHAAAIDLEAAPGIGAERSAHRRREEWRKRGLSIARATATNHPQTASLTDNFNHTDASVVLQSRYFSQQRRIQSVQAVHVSPRDERTHDYVRETKRTHTHRRKRRGERSQFVVGQWPFEW